jgi:glycosyltransferase involved in cell wall biosynthesis
LLGSKFGFLGRVAGSFADILEQQILERSRLVITIAAEHEHVLPAAVRYEHRCAVLENWANIDELPVLEPDNQWSRRFGLHLTRNIVYSGTLGMKHDLGSFVKLAHAFKDLADVRVVIVSSGQAADLVARQASREGLANLLVLPFQPNREVPQVLASASVLIASLDPSAGGFCIPSKVLSYLCAGRPIVIALDERNPAARMVREAGAGAVVKPGDSQALIDAVADSLFYSERRRQQGAAARLYAERVFDLNDIASRFLQILKRAGVEPSTTALPSNVERLAKSAAATN